MSDDKRIAIGFVTMAGSYNDCAKHLIDAIATKSLSIRNYAPVDYLVVHSLELLLKAARLSCGAPLGDVERFRHDLLRLYNENRKCRVSSAWIKCAETTVRERWKAVFAKYRDDVKGMLERFGLTDTKTLREFGVHSNRDIGENLPELRDQIVLLNQEHSRNGGHFRYYEGSRFITRPHAKVDGPMIKTDIARQSLVWANDCFIDPIMQSSTNP